MQDKVVFSLILSTLNRFKEIEIFLYSLEKQTFDNYELIIIDQNNNHKIKHIVDNFSHLNIKLYKSDIGLSKGRNKGLQYANGSIVAFPDDDCFYDRDLLKNANDFFLKHPDYTLLTGKTIDFKTKEISAGKIINISCDMKCSKFGGSSTSLFINRENLNPNYLHFDEKFGLGAFYKCEEENDLIATILNKGYKGRYEPDLITIFHPKKDADFENYTRAYNNGFGLGAFIAKHIFSICGFGYFLIYLFMRPPVGSFAYLIIFDLIKSKYYFKKWCGIWNGFICYAIKKRDYK